jgi:hypothetical protein
MLVPLTRGDIYVVFAERKQREEMARHLVFSFLIGLKCFTVDKIIRRMAKLPAKKGDNHTIIHSAR